MLMYCVYIPLFRWFPPCLAFARDVLAQPDAGRFYIFRLLATEIVRYFGCILIAPSSRIVVPLIMVFS